MCKKKTTNITGSIASMAEPYLNRKKNFLDLKFSDTIDRDIALYCLDHNVAMVLELKLDKKDHLDLLKRWVWSDYQRYITLLNIGVDNDELLNVYLYRKFVRELEEPEDKEAQYLRELSIIRSYTKQTVFKYKYVTKHGETVGYFDEALGIPTNLTINAYIDFKLIESRPFVEKIDMDIRRVDVQIVAAMLHNLANTIVRDTVLECIKEQNLYFFDLSKYYTMLNDAIMFRLNEQGKKCGLEITAVNIIDIAVPNNTGAILESQFFAIAEQERVKNFEFKMEKQSLDLYEKKASIHNKYPDYPITLTEMEKDFALKRYLQREGVDTSLSAKIIHQKLDQKEEGGTGTITKGTKVELSTPPMPKKPKGFRIFYYVSLSIALTTSLLLFIAGVVAGFSALGCTVFIWGILAAVKFNALKRGAAEQKAYREDKKKIDDYKTNYGLYHSDETDTM